MGNTPNLELRVSRPGGSAVVRDYLAGSAAAVTLYGSHYASPGAYSAKADEVDARFDRDARERAASALILPEGSVHERVERFVEDGGYVVTTGQQPALFGGPLYSVYKALTTVRLAGSLEKLLGKPVLPLFWVASEDHDWAEANHTAVVGVDNDVHRAELPAPDPERAPSLHRIPMGGGVEALLEDFLRHLPGTDFSPAYVDLLRESVNPDRTLPESFSELLQALLGRFGLFFTDAAHPALKRASLPVLMAELEGSAHHEAILRGTGDTLAANGYAHQVHLMEGGVNLFLEGPAGRERIYREGGGFRLRNSGVYLTEAEIHARVEQDPSMLSPNVLLRPVVESEVFPTLSYVGGPGEMAYFAQLGALFDAFGIRMPVIHPRFSVTVVESKVRKVLDKFHMDVHDLHRPFHEVAGAIARDDMPEGMRRALGRLRGAIGKGVAQLEQEARSIDPTLKGPVQHVRSHAFAALDDLERKVLNAVKRENEITLSQLEKAQVHLFPLGEPQERVINPLYYLMRYGGAFLDMVYERFDVNLT